VGEERCAFVRALVFVNRALMARTHLEEQADNWLREAGTLPPGNGVEKELWEVRALLGAELLQHSRFAVWIRDTVFSRTSSLSVPIS
jgi:hypothetical protein